MRSLLRTIAFTAAVGSMAMASVPTHAATIVIDDGDRDGRQGAALDFTSVEVANRKHGVVIEARFREVVPGDLAVYILPAASGLEEQVKLFSSLRARKVTNSVADLRGVRRCQGLRVSWDREDDTFRARLPARCINGGKYGAVRVRLITEIGADADLSPDGPRNSWPWSRRVTRG